MSFLAMTILLLLFTGPAAEALNERPGTRSWSTAGRAATIRALTVMVLIALLFALDPEVRALLLIVDAVGVDIFLLLLFFQGREMLYWLRIAVLLPAARLLESLAWYPIPFPRLSLFKQHPAWSLYAAAQPAAVALLISLPFVILARVLGNALLM